MTTSIDSSCCPRWISRAVRPSNSSRAGPGSEKHFGDPRAAAQRWQDAGAEWIHLVDLDAAFGRGNNAEIIAEVTSHLRLNVELSGGIRDDETLERALATGCARVNIGTAALENPEWCEEIIAAYGDRIAIGLDVRGSKLAARGWTRDGGDLYETLSRLDQAGCARFVVTDVNSDGMLAGPNLDLLTAGVRGDGRSRWWPAAGSPPSTTSWRWPRWSRRELKVPSLAPRCTWATSPSRRP